MPVVRVRIVAACALAIVVRTRDAADLGCVGYINIRLDLGKYVIVFVFDFGCREVLMESFVDLLEDRILFSSRLTFKLLILILILLIFELAVRLLVFQFVHICIYTNAFFKHVLLYY